MTVSSETNKVTYAGDGATNVFSTAFLFDANNEVSVILVDADSVETEWLEGTQYTLTGAGTGAAGNVTVDTSPTDYTPQTGETLVIRLAPAFLQQTAFPRGGVISPVDIEASLDNLVRIDLRQNEVLDRTLRLPVELSGISPDLPAPEANKVLSWNTDADAIVNKTVNTPYNSVETEEQTATSGQTVFTLTTITYAVGVNNLAVYINGVRQQSNAFTETNETTVTFSSGLTAGDAVEFVTNDIFTTSNSLASTVSYTPSGTGAVATNVKAKLSESVSVKDFGATGDGVTDDTAAISSCLNSGNGLIYIPDGTYLVDQVDISNPVMIIISPQATIKQRSGSNADIALFAFQSGSSNSSIEGGVFDGDRAGLDSGYVGSSNKFWTAIRNYNQDNVTVSHVKIRNFVTTGIYHGSGESCTYRNIQIETCGKGITAQYSDNLTVENITMTDIGNNSKGIFQHGNEWRNLTNSYFNNIVMTDFQPDIVGIEPSPSAIILERNTECRFSNIVIDGYTGAETNFNIGFTSDNSQRCTFSDITVIGYEKGMPVYSNDDCLFSNIIIDGEFVASSIGLIISNSGLYPNDFEGALSANARSNSTGRNLTFNNCLFVRNDDGVYVQGGEVTFGHCKALGNIDNGFVLSEGASTNSSYFPNHPAQIIDHVLFDNCTANYNGGAGIRVADCESVAINGGSYSNNGQDSALANSARSGVSVIGANTRVKVSVNDAELTDDQTWTKTNAGSFDPGTTDANNQFVILLDDPDQVNVGQYLTLKNATGAADVTAKVVDVYLDEVTVECSGSTTFADTSNLTALTGTLSSSGTAVTGVGTAFDTEIIGPCYLKADGEYRRVIRVSSATSLTLGQAFTADLSADTAELVQINVEAIQSQQYGFYANSSATGPFSWSGVKGEVENVTYPISVEPAFETAEGQQILRLFKRDVNVNTGGASTTIYNNVPEGFKILGWRFIVTTALADTDGTISIKIVQNDSGTTTTLASGVGIAQNSKSSGWIENTSNGEFVPLIADSNTDFSVQVTGGTDNVPSAGVVKGELIVQKPPEDFDDV